MPDLQIAAYAVGVLTVGGGMAAIARGLRQDVREIVRDLMEPMVQRMNQLEKDLAIEREERRKGDGK